ncbi:MAG: hypothetical protein ACFCU6_02535 [Balneolaceae bacterium]
MSGKKKSEPEKPNLSNRRLQKKDRKCYYMKLEILDFARNDLIEGCQFYEK